MLRTLFKKGWKAGGSLLRRVKALDTPWGGIQLFEPAPDLSFARAQDEWELRHEIYLLAGIEAYADAPPSKADQPKTRCTAGPITPIPSVGWPPRHRSQRVQKCASSCMIRASTTLQGLVVISRVYSAYSITGRTWRKQRKRRLRDFRRSTIRAVNCRSDFEVTRS